MAKFPKLPLWTDSLLGDTYHLTPAEFGAYMRLLIAAWRRSDCALPNDDEFLGRIVGDTKNWYRLRKVLGFFHLREDGMWVQGHLLDERDSCSRYSERQTAAGKASALKRKNRDATAVQPKTQPNTQPNSTPIPSPSPNVEELNGSSHKRATMARSEKTKLPEGFPLQPHLETAKDYWLKRHRQDLCARVDDIGEQFRAYHLSHGTKSARWESSWQTWYVNAVGFEKINGNGYPRKESSHEQLRRVSDEIEDDLIEGIIKGKSHKGIDRDSCGELPAPDDDGTPASNVASDIRLGPRRV